MQAEKEIGESAFLGLKGVCMYMYIVVYFLLIMTVPVIIMQNNCSDSQNWLTVLLEHKVYKTVGLNMEGTYVIHMLQIMRGQLVFLPCIHHP